MIRSVFIIALLFALSEQRAKRRRDAAGDLSRSGVVKSQMMFFSTELLPHESEPYRRRLLNEDEQLDEGHQVPFREANKMIHQFLKDKSLINHGHRALQKRISREYFKTKNIPEKTDIPVRLLHDAVTQDEVLYFANRWVTWMYFDLLKELSMYREGMNIQEAYKEAETFGLSFQTWRMLKNEEPNFDEGWWDNDWWDDDDEKEKSSSGDWVKDMEDEMKKIREEHDRHFKEMDEEFEKTFGKTKTDDNDDNETIETPQLPGPDESEDNKEL